MLSAIIFNMIITIPIIEYSIHYLLHSINSTTHKEHHIETHAKQNKIEKYIVVLIPPLYYLEFYLVSLGILQYWLIHTLIHFYPYLLPNVIVKHHTIHHNNPTYNYAISNPYIDWCVNTYMEE